jgi:5-methylcytosine-specific restriction endonuclease McrA
VQPSTKQKRAGSSRPELSKAQWQRIRKAVRARDGNACRNCGASGDGVRLSVHHWLPANLGGTDDMSNLVTLCSTCHPIYEKAARTLTLPVDTRGTQEKTLRANGKRTSSRRTKPTNHDRYASHPAPFRGPDGQPWSRQWYEY